MGDFPPSVSFHLPLGVFPELRGRSGLPCNHRGGQAPGSWKPSFPLSHACPGMQRPRLSSSPSPSSRGYSCPHKTGE